MDGSLAILEVLQIKRWVRERATLDGWLEVLRLGYVV